MKNKFWVISSLVLFVSGCLFFPGSVFSSVDVSYEVLFVLCSPEGYTLETKNVRTKIQPLDIQHHNHQGIIPVIVHGTYWIDELETPWDEIAGKAGILRAELILINQHLDDEKKQLIPYLAQIQVPMDLRKATLLHSFSADLITIGHTQTLSYSGLLQNTMKVEWEAYSESWQQEDIMITLMPKVFNMEIPSLEPQMINQLSALKEMEFAIIELIQAMALMQKSALELDLGFQRYHRSFKYWSFGFQELHQNLPKITDVFSEMLKKLEPKGKDLERIIMNLEEAKSNFDTFNLELEKTLQNLSQALLQIQILFDNHEIMLEISNQTALDSVEIRQLCHEIRKSHPEDSSPWILADKVLSLLNESEGINTLLTSQTKRIQFVQAFLLGVHQKISENYLPLLSEAQMMYQEMLLEINHMEESIRELQDAMEKGKSGSKEAVKGSQLLIDQLSPLELGQNKMDKGIKQIVSIPGLVISGLQRLRREAVSKMLKTSQLNYQNFIIERNRFNELESISKKHKNKAMVIKIKYPEPLRNELLSHANTVSDDQYTASLFQKITQWVRSLFKY